MKGRKWGMIIPTVFLLVAFSGLVNGAISTAERQALIDLYVSTNGDAWNNNSGWKTPPLDVDGFAMPGTEGNWKGVTVYGIIGMEYVACIDLGFNNLNGTVPASIGNFSSLTLLDLAYNNLGGTMPAGIQYLGNLNTLVLSGCGFSGPLPAWLGNLSNLEQLVLASNNFDGVLPANLVNLTNLKNLNVGNNRFDPDTIPSWLGNMTSLEYLQLYGNNFYGTITSTLQNLTNLKTLHLGNNQLYGVIPPWIGLLYNLRKLDLSWNLFSGTVPLEMGNLINLTHLYLQHNNLGCEGEPECFCYVSYTQTLPDGRVINVNKSLHSILLCVLAKLKDLRYFCFEHNCFCVNIEELWAVIVYLEHLEVAWFSFNHVCGVMTNIIEDYGYNCSLTLLNLGGNYITGNIPEYFYWNCNLKKLYLNSNYLEGPVPDDLMLTPLTNMSLRRNYLFSSNPALIAWLYSLDPFWDEQR